MRSWSHLYYKIRAFFFPYNVVKVAALPRTWVDRDYLMFHAMFQILVDFVEREQPFVDCNRYEKKRFTDLDAMRAWVEENCNTEEARKDYYWDGIDDADKANMDRQFDDRYKRYTEILDLYQWYKEEKWDEDSVEDYDPFAHDAMIDSMLQRLLKVRTCLWT